jgi:hypothetical protein
MFGCRRRPPRRHRSERSDTADRLALHAAGDLGAKCGERQVHPGAATCDANGLVRPPKHGWIFIDWVDGDQNTSLQMMWLWAQRAGVRLAKRMGGLATAAARTRLGILAAALSRSWPGGAAAVVQVVVKVRCLPPEWRTAICLPDDTPRSPADYRGELNPLVCKR